MRFLAIALALVAYVVQNIAGRYFLDLSYYLISIVAWVLVTVSVVLINYRYNRDSLFSFRFKNKLILSSLTLAVLQLLALVSTGFFFGFGMSAYAFTLPYIIINTAFFGTTILAFELARAYTIRMWSRKRILLGVVAISFIFTLLSFNWVAFTAISDPMRGVEFVGGRIIPAFAINLLASYLALLGGPLASLAYVFPLQAFQWLIPVQPNPDWMIRSIVNVAVPAVGFLMIGEVARSTLMVRVGLMRRADLGRGKVIAKKSSAYSWLVVLILVLVLVWIPTGMLGFKPTVLVSGSMSPSLNVGDIVVTATVTADQITTGDVVQYIRADTMILVTHRVLEITQVDNNYKMVTKGDASNTADQPIMVTGKIGKVIFTIPQLGWATIYLRSGFSQVAQYVTSNVAISLSVISMIFVASLIALYNYKWRNLR